MRKAQIHHHLIITTLQKGIFCPFSGLASFLPMLLLLFLFARFFLQLLLGDNIFFLCVANVANVAHVRLERNLFSCLLWRSPVGWILTFWRKPGPCLFYIDENPSQLHISCWYTRFGLPRFLHLKLKKSQKHFWRSRRISFHRQKICFPLLKQLLFYQSPSNVRWDTPLPVIFIIVLIIMIIAITPIHYLISGWSCSYRKYQAKSSLILSAPCHQNLLSY